MFTETFDFLKNFCLFTSDFASLKRQCLHGVTEHDIFFFLSWKDHWSIGMFFLAHHLTDKETMLRIWKCLCPWFGGHSIDLKRGHTRKRVGGHRAGHILGFHPDNVQQREGPLLWFFPFPFFTFKVNGKSGNLGKETCPSPCRRSPAYFLLSPLWAPGCWP